MITAVRRTEKRHAVRPWMLLVRYRFQRLHVTVANSENFRKKMMKLGCHFRVKMGAGVVGNKCHRVFNRPGFFVRARRRQRIEHVGHRDNAPRLGNRLARQAIRVPAAIPLFMMAQGDLGGQLERAES